MLTPQLPRRPRRADRLLLGAHRRRRGVDPAADVPLQRARHGRGRHARVRRSRRDLPPFLGLELLAGDEPHRSHRHLDPRHAWPTCWPTTSTARKCPTPGSRRPTAACACSVPRRCRPRSTTSSRAASGSTPSAVPTASPRQARLLAAAGRAATSRAPPASSTPSTSTSASSTTTTTSSPAAPRARSWFGRDGPTSCSRATGGDPR